MIVWSYLSFQQSGSESLQAKIDIIHIQMRSSQKESLSWICSLAKIQNFNKNQEKKQRFVKVKSPVQITNSIKIDYIYLNRYHNINFLSIQLKIVIQLCCQDLRKFGVLSLEWPRSQNQLQVYSEFKKLSDDGVNQLALNLKNQISTENVKQIDKIIVFLNTFREFCQHQVERKSKISGIFIASRIIFKELLRKGKNLLILLMIFTKYERHKNYHGVNDIIFSNLAIHTAYLLRSMPANFQQALFCIKSSNLFAERQQLDITSAVHITRTKRQKQTKNSQISMNLLFYLLQFKKLAVHKNTRNTFFELLFKFYFQTIIQSFFSNIISKQILMNLKEKLQSLIKMNDFFNSRQLFRIQKENDYRTVTGGFISATIITIIIIGFARMIIDTLNLSIITYTTKIDKQMTPGPLNLTATSESNFMFGLELGATNQFYQRFNLSSNTRYFDFNLFYINLQSGATVNAESIPLQMCTNQHWKKIKNSVQNFDKLNVTNWLCPRLGSSLSLYGKYTNSKSSMIHISGSPCRNETDPNRLCASPQQIDNFFSRNGDQFYITIYYVNTLINPDQQDYLTYYLEDMTYVGFGKKMGNEVHLQFEEYVIKTDYSIWPFQDLKQQKGFIISDKIPQYPYQIKTSDAMYFFFTLWRSDKSYYYKRQVQKISATLSFMGGLIGAVVAVLFMVNSFTNYSYQVSLAVQIFRKENSLQNQDKDSEEQKKANSIEYPNIVQYIKFNFYKLQKFVCKDTHNAQMQKLNNYREEVLKQLDVRLLIRRIIFLQFCLKHIFQDYELIQLQENFPSSPEDIRFIREQTVKKTERKIHRTQVLILDQKKNQFNCTEGQLNGNKIFRSQRLVQDQISRVKFDEQKIDGQRQSISQNILAQRIEKLQRNLQDFPQIQPKLQNVKRLFQSCKNGNKMSQRILDTAINNLESRFGAKDEKQIKKSVKFSQIPLQFDESQKLPIISLQIPVQKGRNTQLINKKL